jgi:hypothetical protein
LPGTESGRIRQYTVRKSPRSTASEEVKHIYQCHVRERAQGEYRDLSRKLEDLVNQELGSALLNLLADGIREVYMPEAIGSVNKVSNTRLSTIFA